MMELTIKDLAGTDDEITVHQDLVEETLLAWFPGAPQDVRDALASLQEALDRGEPTQGQEAYLAIRIIRG